MLARLDDAVKSFARAIELGGRTSRMLGYSGYVLGLAGSTGEARALLSELEQRAREDYVPPYFPALVLAGLGERSQALDRLALSVRSKDTMVRDLAVDTPWWSFREEPAYQALLGEMGLRGQRFDRA